MASLIDYDNGGRLIIYPLCDVSLDGRTGSASTDPIVVASYSDIGKITNMYSTSTGETPFEPVEKAYTYLADKSKADKKRLLIITDGMFNGFSSNNEFETRLLGMTENGLIDVYYFGSGDAVRISANEADGLYTQYMPGTVDTQILLDFVTDLCGTLFNQTKIMSSKSSLTKIDLAENSKVIVFANGKESTVSGLKDENEIAVPFLYDTGRHKYSTTKASGFADAPIDTNLDSYICIFQCDEAGYYTLDSENSEYVNIYVQQDPSAAFTASVSTEPVARDTKASNNRSIMLAFLSVLVAAVVICSVLFVHKKFREQRNSAPASAEKTTEITKRTATTNYVLISYSTKNKESAYAIRTLLHKNGIATWIAPNDIPAGSKYAAVINKAIKKCLCFLLLLTRDSQKSRWVPKEVERAVNYGKTIIPIQLDDVVLNNEFEMYISTDQILPIKKIDEASSEICDLIDILKIYTKLSDESNEH